MATVGLNGDAEQGKVEMAELLGAWSQGDPKRQQAIAVEGLQGLVQVLLGRLEAATGRPSVDELKDIALSEI